MKYRFTPPFKEISPADLPSAEPTAEAVQHRPFARKSGLHVRSNAASFYWRSVFFVPDKSDILGLGYLYHTSPIFCYLIPEL